MISYHVCINFSVRRIGVGPNGYMDTELALKWLEDFNDQTKGKNESPRVLVLDGHASHTGRAFLDRAEELGIHVVSYPPHTTHALQGLDVVVFASLKRHWQAVRDARERETGLPIRKEDFILLYSAARTATLTPQIITEAFRKTGLYPVNRSAVSSEQMAPSTESARYAAFPADLASPVKAVLAANRYPVRPQTLSAGAEGSISGELTETDGRTTPVNPFDTNDPSLYTPSKRAKTMNFLLEKTSASFLVEKRGQLTSDKTIPKPVFERPENTLAPDWSVLQVIPTPSPTILQAQLGKAKAFTDVLESCLETANAQLILAHLEIERLRIALQETSAKAKTKNSRGKLMSSGTARLLTSVEFRDALRADEEVAQAKVDAKALKGRKAAITKAKKAWRARDVADRKKRRAEQVEEHKRACKTAERAGRRKPKMPKALTRPSTPEDAFFEAELDAQELIELSDGLDDEEEEE